MKKSQVTWKSRAFKYAALGLHVHPLHTILDGNCSCDAGSECRHPGKHPRTLNGVQDATVDRKTIKAWWKRWPSANIGIATGRVSDIFVLDVDGHVGKASLKKLKTKHGRLPKTVKVETGRGFHRYFRRDGAHVGNSVGKLGKGIDVRGDGGYIVAAGMPLIARSLGRSSRRLSKKWAGLMPVLTGTRYISAGPQDSHA